jgi:hypothetical protein
VIANPAAWATPEWASVALLAIDVVRVIDRSSDGD